MTIARRVVTSIVRAGGAATALGASTVSKEVVPLREEVFSTDALASPQGVRDALHLIQRHVAEATQSARSLPVQGGAYWPNVTLVANTPHTFVHGIQGGLPIAWLPLSIRPTLAFSNAVSQGRIIEISQNTQTGRLVLASSENVTVDLWLFPRPSPEP